MNKSNSPQPIADTQIAMCFVCPTDGLVMAPMSDALVVDAWLDDQCVKYAREVWCPKCRVLFDVI